MIGLTYPRGVLGGLAFSYEGSTLHLGSFRMHAPIPEVVCGQCAPTVHVIL